MEFGDMGRSVDALRRQLDKRRVRNESGEVRGMTWDEVDLESGLWTLPKERMKAFREHVVPLSPRPAS